LLLRPASEQPKWRSASSYVTASRKNYSRFEGGKKYSVVIILMSMDALCDGRDADGSLGICAEWL
jgi:hypothetical protein